MNDLYYGAEGAEEAAAILCQLDTNSTEDLPSAISRLLMSKESRDWTEDDILECVVRVLQTIQYRPPSASRYWCIREIDERTCHIVLLNQKSDEKVAVYSTLSRDDPAVELAEFKLSIPGLSASDSFHRVLRHFAGNLSVDCTEYCSGNYHVIPAKIGFKLTDLSSSCLKVQLPTLAELSVATQDVKGYKEFTRNDSLYANSSTRITIPPMAGKIPAILDHVRRVCDGYRGIVEIVRKQINQEKQERIQ
ncbi:hypothetical protein P3T76_008253 [Phytophthora citrophthora]|uniref:Uncharacterized protein n=1 Tax=Phytophthora citrophthora TaxID=4793 RepID=A0AAD9GK36_9STRA|nr:hypothetical protein P3T76_008253 [Phytophthora citrophthora]